MAALKPASRAKRSPRRDSESTPTLPAFRPPQLAMLRRDVPAGDGWLFETKYDGYRCEVAVAGDLVRLYTRRGHDWSWQFGAVAPAFSRLTRGSALIDGELCAIGPAGRSNFTLLKNSLDGKTPLVYFAFDLLEQDGEDLTDLPLLERKARLERLLSKLPGKSPIRYRITSSATATKCWRRCLPAGRKASSPSGPMLVIRPASGFQLGRGQGCPATGVRDHW